MYYPKIYRLPKRKGAPPKILTQEDYEHASKTVDLEIALIKAVAKVESNRMGFNADGNPVILFEGHWFHRYTDGQYDKDFPTISYPKWTKQFYGKNQTEEWGRYLQAVKLSVKAAELSTSWGKFQIMGFNYHNCIYPNVDAFVSDMFISEGKHLEAFINFIQFAGMIDELREHRFKDFARLYNGSEYWKNQYDIKMESAYNYFHNLK